MPATDREPALPAGRCAQDFADRAQELRRAVEDPEAEREEISASFDSLSRSDHALRDEVERSDDRDARRDLRPVTRAYLDVEDDRGGAGAGAGAQPSRYCDRDDDDGGPG